MTREEITSYRPAQDPPIDPSQGQAPVQVSTNLAVEPRPPPRAPVMSTAEIAAYRSGEDPAYDPVERRGWWEVDMAQGRPLSVVLENILFTRKNAKKCEMKYSTVNPISCWEVVMAQGRPLSILSENKNAGTQISSTRKWAK